MSLNIDFSVLSTFELIERIAVNFDDSALNYFLATRKLLTFNNKRLLLPEYLFMLKEKKYFPFITTTKNEKKLEEKLSCSLSDEQKDAFESLKGTQFALPERPFNYPGRGRGPGGSKDKGPGEKGSGERGPDKRGPDGKPPHDRKAECEKCTDHHSGPASRISYSINSQLEIGIF